VLRKATAFPLGGGAIDNCSNRKVDYLGSPVINFALLPISWISSTVIPGTFCFYNNWIIIIIHYYYYSTRNQMKKPATPTRRCTGTHEANTAQAPGLQGSVGSSHAEYGRESTC